MKCCDTKLVSETKINRKLEITIDKQTTLKIEAMS